MQDNNQLLNDCSLLKEVAENAQEWVLNNNDIVRADTDNLLKSLRRSARTLKKCHRSLQRKMCAGVFGPSQAGKSYLLSALARDEKGQLMAVFDDRTLDFISEINPEGGKESTGLVTRFTLSETPAHPAGFPVYLRLLSEFDLVKIIANTYYADCEHKQAPDREAISAALDALEGRRGQGDRHVTVDEIEELHEYIWSEFASKPRAQALQEGYWSRAEQLAPALDIEGRIALYGLIWDGVPQYNNMLRLLLRELAKLDFAEDAFCGLDSLTPRETSIIDVAMLDGLGQPDGASLAICSARGSKVEMARATVTALTAEITIVMHHKTFDFFDHTDLLDFPGYRSRYKITDIKRELDEKPDMAKQMFLRGKVAYLFQRYCAEKELTSMLLCIGPSNQEVQDLPGVINSWIESTHGQNDEERAKIKDDSLFFVLTKFDIEFEQKKGSTDTKSRWDNRLHASLLDFFGKQHDWPKKWKAGKPFNNIFFLRNPNFRFDSIMDISEDGKEEGIREGKKDYVNDLENSFLTSELVRQHFRDPEESWKAAMKLNDGGIGLICKSLSPLCDPAIKSRQLENNIVIERDLLLNRLSKYYFSDDKEEEYKKKKNFIGRIFALFGKKEIFQQRFGELLGTYAITSDEVYAMHKDADYKYSQYLKTEQETAVDDSEDTFSDIDENSFSLDALNAAFGDEPEEQKSQEADKVPASLSTDSKDEHSFYVDHIIGELAASMYSIAESVDMQRYYAFPAQEFITMASELRTIIDRMQIRRKMLEGFRLIAQPADVSRDSKIRKQASFAASLLNNFTCWLGKGPADCSAEERFATIDGKKVPVFTSNEIMDDLPVLPDVCKPFSREWYKSWLLVFSEAVLDNVSFDGEKTLNREQNALLGNILTRIGSCQATGRS